MKLKKKKLKLYQKAKQNCNFYKSQFNTLKQMLEKGYFKKTIDKEKVTNHLDYLKNLIDIYTIESKVEYIYLPNKKIQCNNIKDLLYYENMYGKEIYKEKKYN